MKHLVHTEGKTHQEISNILRKRNPGIKGLSMISVGRFCVKNGIRTRKTVEEIDTEKKASKCAQVIISLNMPITENYGSCSRKICCFFLLFANHLFGENSPLTLWMLELID